MLNVFHTSSYILMDLPAEETRRCMLLSVIHGGGCIIVLTAISWDSLGLTITPQGCVMAEAY